MFTFRTRDLVGLVMCAMVAGGAIGWAVRGDQADPVPVITEDMPGWDCRTMGNGMCAGDLGWTAGQQFGEFIGWTVGMSLGS